MYPVASKVISKLPLFIFSNVKKVKLRRGYSKAGLIERSKAHNSGEEMQWVNIWRPICPCAWAFRVSDTHMKALCGQRHVLFPTGVRMLL